MVTAELAVALPTLVLVAMFAVSGLQVAMAQLACRDAAGVAARLAARGESDDVVAAAVGSTAPVGSHLSIRDDGNLVVASVHAQVRLAGIGRLLPAVEVTETVVAVQETAPA